MGQKRRQNILIADDSEMNRSILADMLGDEYEIVEAEDGVQAVAALQKYGSELSVVLLDIVMPKMDGFGVLTWMNQQHWIEDIPVIMISAESSASHVERAYGLGVTDFISRPFDALVVHRRVVNTILLYAKQKKLVNMVADQIYEKEQNNNLMIDILSHIVEFRNGESGMHVLHVRTLTELLLKTLMQKTDRYNITQADISMIGTASALHDIGKIAIPDEVLNKPGKLTNEEFALMKTHSMIGADMLSKLPFHQQEPLVKVAYDICRWHHERYDGRGYPDGLKGDEIPISAQIVAMADVYDALTSERVYKPPIPHETAVQMILDGKCGVFNPLMLECLQDIAPELPDVMNSGYQDKADQRTMQNIVQEMQRHEELTASERTLQLLEHERMKYNFFASLTEEIQFEYTLQPAMVTLTSWGAEKLGLEEFTIDPRQNRKVLSLMKEEDLQGLAAMLHSTTPGNPVVTYDCQIQLPTGPRWFRITARAMWSSDEPPRYTGTIGKAIDVHESRTKLNNLEQMASHDAMTNLLNHANARERIMARLKERPDGRYAMAILDLDHFKSANDTFGHMFGDEVLKYIAERLRHSVRSGDIAARVGGDEFLIFLEYKTDPELAIQRVYQSLAGGKYENFPISISMGVAVTAEVGTEYETLFHAADQALYTVKRGGRGHYRFFDSSMEKTLSVISPIDNGSNEQGGESK
ncbi:MAG: diguanylate cyclase [Lawsonibacter sp.]|nr:diguanylate cyclase [Lawsonibacter sp.]MCI8914405.1 diguanylate cyclase [Lawsonibacter sp.]